MPIFLRGKIHPSGNDVEVEYEKQKPQILTKEVSFEQVLERWNNDLLQSSIPLEDLIPGMLIQRIWEEENSLDQSLHVTSIAINLPDLSTLDAQADDVQYANGVIGGIVNNGPSRYTISHGTIDMVIKNGHQVYALMSGDASPTTGILVLKMLVANA